MPTTRFASGHPLDPDFWRDREVLVTGHTGFKGAWLALWLSRMGARVSGLSLDPPSSPGLYQLLPIVNGQTIRHHRVDLRDHAGLTAAVTRIAPEIVFHLAAQSLVRRGYRDPVTTIATNVLGTVHLFEALRGVEPLRAVVNVTSDKCYHNHEWPWGYRESDRLGGHDPYSASKAAAELMTDAWRSSYFAGREPPVAIASARGGNVIGGGDWGAERLIPDLVRAFTAGRRLVIRYPDAVRPWQHVFELLRGYLQLAQALVRQPELASQGWNFGPVADDEQSVGWLVERAAALWGEGAEWEVSAEPRPHEASMLKLDASRARQLLAWQAHWGVEQALAETIGWYRAWHRGEAIEHYSIAQLERYQSEVSAGLLP